ncbi:hypothetical protein BJ875DRAFT_98988 [Amylocarpus encephaloides]|uniref:Extracellular serine-rich protein n=1 Tax=Amylocarpus encephaloides TaxID=45428 RepID=A0A9P7YDS9_9HELO|nr:hypothetical protein BJ875DRAFT_98988 [Amylocarpus encephaloides]
MLKNVYILWSVVLVGVKLCYAQTSTSSAPAPTHTISVGADGLKFTPNEIEALVGDIIEYRFYPQNHSVARAAFGENPCIPYELTGPGRIGFWSGFKPVQTVGNDLPVFRIEVNDTNTFFFYCSSPGACSDGMVGVVNPNSTFSFKAQLNYTTKAKLFLSPGEGFPEEVAKTTSAGATPSPTPTSGANTAPATTSSATVPADHKHLSTGVIIGIALGGFAVLVLAAALMYMFGRQKTMKEIFRQSQLPPPNHNSFQPTPPGFSESHYPNMQKASMVGAYAPVKHYTSPGADQQHYRSASPPVDERTRMMGMGGAHQYDSHPTSAPGSPGYPSSAYTHEMESPELAGAAVGMRFVLFFDINSICIGLSSQWQVVVLVRPTLTLTSRPYNPDEIHRHMGPHELPVASPVTSPLRSPSVGNRPSRSGASRPFSYTDSESGYRPEKDSMLR